MENAHFLSLVATLLAIGKISSLTMKRDLSFLINFLSPFFAQNDKAVTNINQKTIQLREERKVKSEFHLFTVTYAK